MRFPRSPVMRFAGLVLGALGIFLLAEPVVAQNRRLSFGIHGGLSLANFGIAQNLYGKPRTGFQLGGFATFPMGSHVAIQSAVFYSQEGSRLGSFGFNGTTKLDYIEVPLLLKLSPSLEGSPLHPFVLVGPAVGFQVSCGVRRTSGSSSVEESCSDSAAGIETKPVQFGVHFGVGLQFGRIALGFNYLRGMTSIVKRGPYPNTKNRVLAIVVGYRLGGKH